MPRATAPMPWATASQKATIPRSSAPSASPTGFGPLRTDLGAGRPAVAFLAVDFFGAGLRAGGRLAALEVVLVEVLRGRVPELVPLPVLLVLRVDVLVLRDPGGEDVRVAMVTTLGDHPTSHRD